MTRALLASPWVLAGLLVLRVDSAEAEPLRVETVLERSARHSPKILEAREKVRATRARRLGAEGAFDRELAVDASSRVTGYYSGRYVGGRYVQPLRDLGGEIYGGYRISGGDFPVYEDQYATLGSGEIAFGATLALLRDREFDRRRHALREAELAVDMARLDALLESVEVQHDAMVSYWEWVAAGQRLAIYRELLSNAEDRVTALSIRLNEGDVAQIDIVENAQRILFRRSLVVNATRDLANAALELSLYDRADDGTPRVPGDDELPAAFPEPDSSLTPAAGEYADALVRQAELQIIERRLESAANLRRLGENDLLPRVDVGMKVARDFGSGSPTRDETDVILGVEISIPLERRKARGAIAAAQAEARALEFSRQRLEERFAVQIGRVRRIIDASLETALYAQLEVEQARRLEEAEWVKFEEGASDFFLLNLREESTADARLRAVTALAAYYQALADYRAITADLEALGLGT